MKKIKKISRIIVLIVCVGIVCLTTNGCVSGKRSMANQGRMYNNKDEIKIIRLRKIITMEDRDYYVIYAQFKNNSGKQLKSVKFYYDLKDKSNEIVQSGSMDIDRIENGKVEHGDCFVTITEKTALDNMGSITFTGYSHSESDGIVASSKEVTYNFNSVRIEEKE